MLYTKKPQHQSKKPSTANKLEIKSELIVFGDSLTTENGMQDNKPFGFNLPGTGLKKSGDGGFADGLSWPGFLALTWEKKLLAAAIEKLQKQNGWDDQYTQKVKNYYWQRSLQKLLQPENELDFLSSQCLMHNYAEGGATAATYSMVKSVEKDAKYVLDESDSKKLHQMVDAGKAILVHPERSMKSVFKAVKPVVTRAIVHNFSMQCEKFYKMEKEQEKGKDPKEIQARKDKMLIAVWFGANDLITVNEKPTVDAALKAVQAILKNISELKQNGYNNFIVFNMPDLTKTPRYKRRLEKGEITPQDVKDMQNVVKFFNSNLQQGLAELECNYRIFDVHSAFNQIYDNPQDYGFDKDKLTKTLSEDPNYKPEHCITSPYNARFGNKKYAFWNEVHPSSAMQEDIFNIEMNRPGRKFDFDQNADEAIKAIEEDLPKQLKNISPQVEFRYDRKHHSRYRNQLRNRLNLLLIKEEAPDHNSILKYLDKTYRLTINPQKQQQERPKWSPKIKFAKTTTSSSQKTPLQKNISMAEHINDMIDTVPGDAERLIEAFVKSKSLEYVAEHGLRNYDEIGKVLLGCMESEAENQFQHTKKSALNHS